MNEKLKNSFEQIRAEDELKRKTKEFISQNTKGYTRKKSSVYRGLTPAAACLAVFLIGGSWLYFVPAATISIDINPSIELGVNRFDRVVSAKGYNDDGKQIVDTLEVEHLNYSEAVDQIMENDEIERLLSEDEIMTIAVIGEDETKSAEILSGVESCTAENRNTYCYRADREEVEKAHEVGLSYGKYRAFLELQKLEPDISAEAVQNMTMREIRNRIDELQGTNVSEHESGFDNGSSGSGNDRGTGKGQGNGADKGGNNGLGNGQNTGQENGAGNGQSNGYRRGRNR